MDGLQSLDVKVIATELGMKDLIILQLSARIKLLEEQVASQTQTVVASNGELAHPVELPA